MNSASLKIKKAAEAFALSGPYANFKCLCAERRAATARRFGIRISKCKSSTKHGIYEIKLRYHPDEDNSSHRLQP